MNAIAASLIPALLFLSSFFLYLKTLCPGVYFGDSGELIAMAYTLGIPHPTGFPLYILLSKLFLYIPIANPAFRMNLMSAVFAAASIVLLYHCVLLVLRNAEDRKLKHMAAVFAALLFMFSYTLWSQSGIARIYSLNAFFCLAALGSFLKYSMENGRFKYLVLLGFITGLGAGLHLSFIIFSALLWLSIIISERKNLLKKIPAIIFFMAAGASVYLYIFIRGLSDTVLSWKTFTRLADFFGYFSQKDYSGKMFTRDLLGYITFLGYAGKTLLREFSIPGMALLLTGTIAAGISKFKHFWLFIIIFLSNILLLAFYGAFHDLQLAFRYFIPSYAALLILGTYGLYTLKNRIPSIKLQALIFPAAIIIALPLAIIKNYHENDRSLNYMAVNYPGDLLMGMPKKANLFSNGDNQIFPLTYAKFVLNKYKDITVYDSVNTIFRDIDNLRVKTGSLKVVTNILTAFEQNKSDIYSTTKLGAPVLNESLNGLSYKITPDFAYSSNLPWKLMPLKNILYDDKIYHEFEQREVAGIYWYRLAEMYLSENNEDLFNYAAGRAIDIGYDAVPVIGNMAIIITTPPLSNFPVAEQLVKKALKLQPYNTELMSNLGSIYGNMGKYREAAEMFEKVIKLEPNNFNAMMFLNKAKEQMMQESMKKAMDSARDAFFNDGMKLMKDKKFKEAAPYFQNDLEKNPALARSNFHLGLIHSINADYNKAIPQFEAALKKEPANFNTLNNLALTYIKLSKTAKAKEYFDKSLKINPDQERVKQMLQDLK
ncbi:MAG: hypothetical protein CVV21_04135 [Candidatus Goldiibacteriota bacterium HGW-Goldbacteria-1]|jgi:tetratricopeptide (TPR) repeat protein|nr:MAG: hypothetical protein CVV21_04135 [Candidatus Goldiibacteriota bacterium HGW-Goldbacteria-1]